MYVKQSAAVLALFLGTSQAVSLSKHHRKQSKFADGYNIVGGENFGESVTMNGPTDQESYSYVQKRSTNGFADGFNIVGGEEFGGEAITMNGPTEQEDYNLIQKGHAKRFAEGYGDHEQFGDEIKTNGMTKQDTTKFVQKRSAHKFADGYNIVGGDNFGETVTMNGPTEQESYSYAQKRSGNRFADGYNIVGGDNFGEAITMNGPAEQEGYNFAQKHHSKRFAEGYGDHEQFGDEIKTNGMTKQDTTKFVQKRSANRFADGYNIVGGDNFGEEITMNGPAEQEGYNFAQKRSANRFADGFNIVNGDNFESTITMNGPAEQEDYNFAQRGHAKRFAEGYGDHEQFGEEIKTNGMTKQDTTKFVQKRSAHKFADGYNIVGGDNFGETVTMNGPTDQESYSYAQLGNGYYSQPVPVPGFVATAAATASQVGLKGAEGKEKIIEAQDLEEFADTHTMKANTRLPYASTLLQTDAASEYWSQTVPVPGFVATAKATEASVNLKGAEAKEAIIDAQDSEEFLDTRTDLANARLPYASTLLQTDSSNGYWSQEVPIPGFVATATATAATAGQKGAEGKEAIIDAQDSEEFLDTRTELSNTRLPYASTLLQTDSENGYWSQTVPVPGFVGTATATAGNLNLKGAEGKEAIIDAQDSEDFLDTRTDLANARLPYASTLLQTDSDLSSTYWSQTVPVPGFVGTAAATTGTAGQKGAEGKEAIIDAQDSEEFLDTRTELANTRLPYASTLLQLNDDPNGNRFLQTEDDTASDDGSLQTVEFLSQAPTQHIPLDFHFVETN